MLRRTLRAGIAAGQDRALMQIKQISLIWGKFSK
jgi:hypothetical protein